MLHGKLNPHTSFHSIKKNRQTDNLTTEEECTMSFRSIISAEQTFRSYYRHKKRLCYVLSSDLSYFYLFYL